MATFLGGLFALKFKDKLHLVLGFSAGAIIGVAFFDLLPESIDLVTKRFDVSIATSIAALAFLLYTILDRMVGLHSHEHDHEDAHHQIKRGRLAAGSLSFHSFIDGMAIGLAFQVSSGVGAIVSTAVLVHDFSDGINTVNLILRSSGNSRQAFRWLVLDALAPAAGALSTLFFSLPEVALGFVLSAFCGFFLYIGASDLLPESFHAHPTRWTTFMTILGMGVLYVAIRLASL